MLHSPFFKTESDWYYKVGVKSIPTFIKTESDWYYKVGVKSIPTFIKNAVNSDIKPYMVAYHYKMDPDVVMSWDNESIVRAYYALVQFGVIK